MGAIALPQVTFKPRLGKPTPLSDRPPIVAGTSPTHPLFKSTQLTTPTDRILGLTAIVDRLHQHRFDLGAIALLQIRLKPPPLQRFTDSVTGLRSRLTIK
ncbi:MAG: hypothetical protein SFY66_00900 [Oculatellaceae cyanobacterium bins.114]|nr:hypothetical protein [Oculatellaceae cyanobacterium bins.114]